MIEAGVDGLSERVEKLQLDVMDKFVRVKLLDMLKKTSLRK